MQEHDLNRRWWNEVTPVHVRSPFYNVDGFLKGEPACDEIERSGVGDIAGKSLLHLQCHFGLTTLSFARLGARVTGVDFSEVGIAQAQELARQAGLAASSRFVCSDVFELNLHEQFDVVFTSYGVLNWLSGLDPWARVIASHLKPQGRFFIAEIHPTAMMLEEKEGRLCAHWNYFHTPEGVELSSDADYADPNYVSASSTREWQWSLADIFRALTGAGLRIHDFREYPFTCFRHFPLLKERPDGHYHLPATHPTVPLLFSLSATKEQTPLQ